MRKDDPFLNAIVELLLFLEMSDSTVLDEDAAVAMLEHTASVLKRLSPSERERFLNYLNRRAEDASNRQEREVLASLGLNLGLT